MEYKVNNMLVFFFFLLFYNFAFKELCYCTVYLFLCLIVGETAYQLIIIGSKFFLNALICFQYCIMNMIVILYATNIL